MQVADGDACCTAHHCKSALRPAFALQACWVLVTCPRAQQAFPAADAPKETSGLSTPSQECAGLSRRLARQQLETLAAHHRVSKRQRLHCACGADMLSAADMPKSAASMCSCCRTRGDIRLEHAQPGVRRPASSCGRTADGDACCASWRCTPALRPSFALKAGFGLLKCTRAQQACAAPDAPQTRRHSGLSTPSQDWQNIIQTC